MGEPDIIRKIELNDDAYPDMLRHIKNPPKQLYYAGDVSLLKGRNVAIVGSRKYTVYGKNVASMIGRRLAESGINVVSGLAFGIDAFAHEGVVEAGGRGIAVLGSGIRKMSPVRNRDLMYKLVEGGGVVISEYPPDMPAEKYTYPERNRIISGLSEMTVVVEANYKSGALITAQFAADQGRPVYAVPGNINSQFSMGSNLLIRDGAVPLIVIDDIVREMNMNVITDEKTGASLGADEKAILGIIKQHSGIGVDEIADAVNERVSRVNSILTVMEIKGVIESYAGKFHLAK